MEMGLWLISTLRNNAELAIFLTLALIYWVGVYKDKRFSLYSDTGTLLIGIMTGEIGIDISPLLKSIFFIMFLFAVGFGVGPQFIQGIASDGLPQALFAVVISVLCLLFAYIAAVLAG